MSIYTPDRIIAGRQAIGRRYEKIVGSPAPMLSDMLAILTGPDVLPLLETLIRLTKIQTIKDEMICCPDDDICGSFLCAKGRQKIKDLETDEMRKP